jgi:hypothetical protein
LDLKSTNDENLFKLLLKVSLFKVSTLLKNKISQIPKKFAVRSRKSCFRQRETFSGNNVFLSNVFHSKWGLKWKQKCNSKGKMHANASSFIQNVAKNFCYYFHSCIILFSCEINKSNSVQNVDLMHNNKLFQKLK